MEIINVTHQLKFFFKLLCVIGVFNLGTAQELQLKIISNDSIETSLINSIGYPKTFVDFDKLQTEVTLFKDQLFQRGYIEAQVLDVIQNPPVITVKFVLGSKYDFIHLYASESVFELLELDDVQNNNNSSYYAVEITALEPLLNSLTAV